MFFGKKKSQIEIDVEKALQREKEYNKKYANLLEFMQGVQPRSLTSLPECWNKLKDFEKIECLRKYVTLECRNEYVYKKNDERL